MALADNKSDNRWITFLSIFLAISLAGNIILFMKRADLIPSKKELIKTKNELSSQVNQYRNEINKYKGINVQIDRVIENANKNMEIKEKQIASLKREKRLQTIKNDNLEMELDSLQNDYLDVIDSLLVEREKMKVVNLKIENLETVISDLNKKVVEAGWLIGDNLKVTPYKQNSSGKRQPSAMLKKVNDIEVCIDLFGSRATKRGVKNIFVVITTPNAEVMRVEGADELTFYNPDYKKVSLCSKVDKIDYQNTKVSLCTIIKPAELKLTGLYVVEVFDNDNKLGMTTFSLK